jgi:hypothetical protein
MKIHHNKMADGTNYTLPPEVEQELVSVFQSPDFGSDGYGEVWTVRLSFKFYPAGDSHVHVLPEWIVERPEILDHCKGCHGAGNSPARALRAFVERDVP